MSNAIAITHTVRPNLSRGIVGFCIRAEVTSLAADRIGVTLWRNGHLLVEDECDLLAVEHFLPTICLHPRWTRQVQAKLRNAIGRVQGQQMRQAA